MNEVNLHFNINEYLIRLETKKDLITELKNEFENLDIKNKELNQTKNKLIEEYKKKEKNNKKLVNLLISSEENKNNNISKEFSSNINNKNNNAIKKRNNSAAISKRRFNADIIKEIKMKNEELNNILINYRKELNNLIKQVDEKEVNCRVLMFNANNHAKFYSGK